MNGLAAMRAIVNWLGMVQNSVEGTFEGELEELDGAPFGNDGFV